MLRKFLNRFTVRSHYWRNLGFDQLSEIYASQMLRSLSLSLVNIFVPVYLYTIGYSLRAIFGFFFVWFAFRLFISPLVAFIVARIGPKHGILLSMVVQMLYLAMLLSLKTMHWPFYLLPCLGSLALSLFWISYHTNLSKIKHETNAGKELSYINIFERVGAILGPLAGGLIANFFDPRYTIFLALTVMALSVIPLLASREPVKINQKITFKGFPYRANLRTSLAVSAFDLDTQSCQIVWPLFVAITVFSHDIFGILGVMTALSVAVGLGFTHAIGRLIDKNKGGELLKFGVWLNSVNYFVRPFVSSITSVFAVNFINDPATTAFRIPFTKGYYDLSDSHEGYRIVFFAVNDWVSSFVRTIFWALMILATYIWQAEYVMRWHFLGMGIVVLAVLLHKFPALVTRKSIIERAASRAGAVLGKGYNKAYDKS